MRITQENVQNVRDNVGDIISYLEDFKEAADQWLELQGETDEDSKEDRRNAREDMEEALEKLKSHVGVEL